MTNEEAEGMDYEKSLELSKEIAAKYPMFEESIAAVQQKAAELLGFAGKTGIQMIIGFNRIPSEEKYVIPQCGTVNFQQVEAIFFLQQFAKKLCNPENNKFSEDDEDFFKA